MEMTDFQLDVIARSYEKPVVVDFWAPWCGPCRMLGPILEQLAKEQADRWILVKINSDEAYELAQQYRVMSIPNVKMFYQGKVIAEFAGALPRQAILQWLDQHIPDARAKELQAILHDVNTGQAEALQALASFVQHNPDVAEARLALAAKVVFTEPDRAIELVSSIRAGHDLAEAADDIRTLVQLLQFSSTDDTPVAQALTQAKQSATEGRLETAIQHLIKAVSIDKSYAKHLPRKAAIALFRILGPEHELTKAWRRQFDMALY